MVFHLCVRNFLINAFYIEYLGCRYGNGSDACVSAGFSRATSERPHHEVKSDTSRGLAHTERSGVAAGHGQHSHNSVTDGGGRAVPAL